MNFLVKSPLSLNGSEIAVIGLAGRFPGAKTINQFWDNLKNGVESISFFTDEELLASGVESHILNDHNFVKARAELDDVELFDAEFFGFSPREAQITDPQHRLFLECSWEALEVAAYNPETFNGLIGVYAGSSFNGYLLNIYLDPTFRNSVDHHQMMIAGDKDFLTTRVSYKLGLEGPSYAVQTACSTSLVAVHLASQGLLNGECDMALAGGVSVKYPRKTGYFYREGGITSPDGHCRTFDAKAQGTVGGEGVGIVVLKRLEDALEDRDCIHAILKGSAINNDGSLKVSYTAPRIDNQAKAIKTTQLVAEVEPETITYVEAHGTGTPLGDPIEIAALTQVFRSKTEQKGFCAIGSVKTNVGHLDAAAGVAGLIKTILALHHKQLPPSLHFEKPNPQIDFASSPFYVNTTLSDWQVNEFPRRAGVSSFGIGGTNAHVILEEAPEFTPSGKSRSWNLLVLSAKTSLALDHITNNLAQHLHSELNLADVAYTLSLGRKAFDHRRILVCQDIEDAKNTLGILDPKRVLTGVKRVGERPTIFMFPGQGAQYVNMAKELYQSEPTFAEHVDNCCEYLKSHLEFDIRHTIYPSEEQSQGTSDRLQQTAITQSALFVIEYALAQLLMEWGVRPAAMLGHSIGEYVAATLAGVFSLEDALAIVVARGKLMQGLPSGSMLAIPLPDTQVQPFLGQELSLAAINGPSSCVVSGVKEAVDVLENQLASQGVDCRRLHTSHAFHSPMMEPILELFTQQFKHVSLNPPQIPYISNVTGTWITPEEAVSPLYWANHLRQTVRLAEGLQELCKDSAKVLLEIGPGRTLTTLAKRYPDKKSKQVVFSSVKHPQETGSDVEFLLKTLAQLWLAGVEIDWAGFYAHQRRHRLSLPTYPFERQHYWIEPVEQEDVVRLKKNETSKRLDISEWFYIPSWKRLPLPANQLEKTLVEKTLGNVLLFVDESGLGEQLATQLAYLSQKVICVKVGDSFTNQADGIYTLNPRQPNEYDALLNELNLVGCFPNTIVHLWSIALSSHSELTLEQLDQSQDLGLHSLIFTAQALGRHSLDGLQIIVVSNNLYEVTGDELISPEKATLLGAVKVIPLEYPNVSCRCVDVIVSGSSKILPLTDNNQLINQLLYELAANSSDVVIAYRGIHRWGQTFEPFQLERSLETISRLKQEGVYLITGGFGGMGFTIAQHLAETVKAKIILLGRSPFPPRKQWKEWLANHAEQDSVCGKIKKIKSLEEKGAKVLAISANVADYEQMEVALIEAQKCFGNINGVFHTAGIVDYEGIIQNRTKDMTDSVLESKVKGTFVLDKLLNDVDLDFFVLFSSIGSVFHQLKFGQVAYNAANEFLDAFTYYKRASKQNTFVTTINWGDWEEVGMSVEARRRKEQKRGTIQEYLPALPSMSPSEGIEVLQRILGSPFHSLERVIISIEDLNQATETLSNIIKALSQNIENSFPVSGVSKYPRPELSNDYVAPRNDIEQKLSEIWQDLIGLEQVGVHDNFFDLGGDSLIGIQLISRIRKELQVEVPANYVFQSPSVAELAVVVEEFIIRELEELSEDEAQRLISATDSPQQNVQ